MNIVKIAFSSLGTIVSLFVFTKLMGNREMSQLSMFDYVSSITIGSIGGEMAVMSTDSFIEPLVAMGIFAVLTIFIAYITCKSIKLRRFFEGHALLLYQNGKLYEKNLLKARLDVDEFLSACRLSGYYDLEEIHTIYMETNGKISVLPKSDKRPATPSDLNLKPTQSQPLANVIIDGKIMIHILNLIGKDEKWVLNQLKSNGVKDLEEVILATFDKTSDSLNIYLKLKKKMTKDIFE